MTQHLLEEHTLEDQRTMRRLALVIGGFVAATMIMAIVIGVFIMIIMSFLVVVVVITAQRK